MSKHFRIPGRLPARLQESGIRVSALLQNAGLPPGLFDQPRITVTTEELFALWRGIGQASTNPAIGLELGTETKPEHFDPIALVALSTGSFGEAMHQMARYKQLSCPEEIIHETDEDEWSIQFRWLLANDAEPEVLTDLCFAWVLSVARYGTGTRISPLRIELVRPRAYAKAIERHFGCSVVGASRNAIVFRASDAALPFVTRNAELLAMLTPQFDEELKQHKARRLFLSVSAGRSRESLRDGASRWWTLPESCISVPERCSAAFRTRATASSRSSRRLATSSRATTSIAHCLN